MPENPAEHWLTYRGLGAVLRCTPNGARMHAHRRGWPHRAPNRVGDPGRVLVPESVVVQGGVSHGAAQCDAQANGAEQAHVHPHDLAHMRATEVLREQLAIANRRIDELQALLADAAEKDRGTDPMTAIGIQTLSQAVETLRQDVERERERADRAERQSRMDATGSTASMPISPTPAPPRWPVDHVI